MYFSMETRIEVARIKERYEAGLGVEGQKKRIVLSVRGQDKVSSLLGGVQCHYCRLLKCIYYCCPMTCK